MDTIPKLTRSALHRCHQCHGISRLPDDTEKTSKRGRFAETKIGYVHIDSCEFRHAEGQLVMFLAIDRVSKFTYVKFCDKAGKMNGAAFLRNVVQAFPYKIHMVLTDNGMAFADLPKYRSGSTECFSHIFDRVCGWRTPFQAICDAWTKDPSIFRTNPHHLIPGTPLYSAEWMTHSSPMPRREIGVSRWI